MAVKNGLPDFDLGVNTAPKIYQGFGKVPQLESIKASQFDPRPGVKCNWGLVEAKRRQWACEERHKIYNIRRLTTYRESYCPEFSRIPHPCHPFEPYATQCPAVEESRYIKNIPCPPCLPKELIREVRPDTQLDTLLLSKDIVDPCDRPCAFILGRLVDGVKTFNDKITAPTTNYNR